MREQRNTDAELLYTPTTIGIDTLARRCKAISPRVAPGTTGISTSDLDVASVRDAFERAHKTAPAWLATLDGDTVLAECSFNAATQAAGPAATIVCPDGHIVQVDRSLPATMYAVDAHLDAVRLPAVHYLFPGAKTTTPPAPCAGLDASSRAP
jgi:hypothetical protein